MKKTIYTRLMTVMLAILSLTACDKDHQMAYYLDGVWNGEIRDNYDTYLVTMEFVQSNNFSRSGYGYEEDCKWNGHVSRVRFDWSVRDQCIYLHYSDGTYYVMECDYFPRYARKGESFRGRIYNERTKVDIADFLLRKTLNHSDRSLETDTVVVIDTKPNVELKENELK